MAHRVQHLGFRVGKPKPRRDALGVLGDGDRKRGEPAHGVWRQPQRAFDRDHRRERAGIGNAAEDRQQQAGIRHGLYRNRGAFRDQQLQHFHAHAFGGKARKSRAAVDAGEISGSVGLTRPVGGMDAEEAQDAQIILGDALAWHRR